MHARVSWANVLGAIPFLTVGVPAVYLAVFRLVLQLYAGVHLLHADDDVYLHGHRLRPAKHMTTAALRRVK